MSISDFLHKIKGQNSIDKNTFMYLCIIIGVGISSFGLGRLSVDNNIINNNPVVITDEKDSLINEDTNGKEISVEQPASQSAERRYVASKNGKMYYPLGCSGAKRIKPENEVWFATREDAEKSGYALSSTCK